jgi:hypothetical protein
VHELLPCVAAMMDALPDAYREALRLTEYEGLSQKELSERLGISFSGAKSRVQRARAKLKQELLACCHFQFDQAGSSTTSHTIPVIPTPSVLARAEIKSLLAGRSAQMLKRHTLSSRPTVSSMFWA